MPPRKKLKKNISGLRNQPSKLSLEPASAEQSPALSPATSLSVSPLPSEHSDASDLDSGLKKDVPILLDSMRVDWEQQDDMSDQSDLDSEMSDNADLDDEELFDGMMAMAGLDDGKDKDWLPLKERKKGV